MKNLGIIVEYNPFHNGHIYHINKSKAITNSENVIAVMSSNFVQRGEPSILNKFSRTKSALENGVDLVLELPTPFSTSSAELFSHAAVSILEKSGIVDSLAFGSECGDINKLTELAKLLANEPVEFKTELKKALDTGVNFPTARAIALEVINPSYSKIISSPNNILGVEYLKSLIRLNSTITPFTINRSNSNYHDQSLPKVSDIASATSIRNYLSSNLDDVKMYVPQRTFDELTLSKQNLLYPNYDNIFYLLKYKLASQQKSDLDTILDCTEGLSSRLISIISDVDNYADLIDKLKSKRYPQSKIQRMFIHLLLNITVNDIELYKSIGYIPYIRVLGFRKEKAFLLKELTEKASVPIVTNIKNACLCDIGNKMLEQEFFYTNIYNTLIDNNSKKHYYNSKLSLLNFEQKQFIVKI